MRFSRDPLIEKEARRLEKSGWVALNGGKHKRLRSPDSKHTITVPGSPSDHRSALNWLHQLRRIERATQA
jgi:hypothetical protein